MKYSVLSVVGMESSDLSPSCHYDRYMCKSNEQLPILQASDKQDIAFWPTSSTTAYQYQRKLRTQAFLVAVRHKHFIFVSACSKVLLSQSLRFLSLKV
jgi:hypothetical protein